VVEISLHGSGEGRGWATGPGYSTTVMFMTPVILAMGGTHPSTPSNQIFADDFESRGTSDWSSVVPLARPRARISHRADLTEARPTTG